MAATAQPSFRFDWLPEELLPMVLSLGRQPGQVRRELALLLPQGSVPGHQQPRPQHKVALFSTNRALYAHSLDQRSDLWVAPQLVLRGRARATGSLGPWLRRCAPLLRSLSLQLQPRYTSLADLEASENVLISRHVAALARGGAAQLTRLELQIREELHLGSWVAGLPALCELVAAGKLTILEAGLAKASTTLTTARLENVTERRATDWGESDDEGSCAAGAGAAAGSSGEESDTDGEYSYDGYSNGGRRPVVGSPVVLPPSLTALTLGIASMEEYGNDDLRPLALPKCVGSATGLRALHVLGLDDWEVGGTNVQTLAQEEAYPEQPWFGYVSFGGLESLQHLTSLTWHLAMAGVPPQLSTLSALRTARLAVCCVSGADLRHVLPALTNLTQLWLLADSLVEEAALVLPSSIFGLPNFVELALVTLKPPLAFARPPPYPCLRSLAIPFSVAMSFGGPAAIAALTSLTHLHLIAPTVEGAQVRFRPGAVEALLGALEGLPALRLLELDVLASVPFMVVDEERFGALIERCLVGRLAVLPREAGQEAGEGGQADG